VAFSFDASSEGWMVFDEFISVLYWIDLLIQMLSAYKDSEDRFIRTRREVFSNYLRGWFLIDLISALPMENIFESIGNTGENKIVKLAKLPRITRLLSLTKMLKFFGYFIKTDPLLVFEYNAGIVKLITMIISFVLMVHLMACVWSYIGVLEYDDPDNWITYF
jgi:hyperpolarization activated cyclic nucleotide-gated potassium channel 1